MNEQMNKRSLMLRTMVGISGNKITEIDLLPPDVHITEEMT